MLRLCRKRRCEDGRLVFNLISEGSCSASGFLYTLYNYPKGRQPLGSWRTISFQDHQVRHPISSFCEHDKLLNGWYGMVTYIKVCNVTGDVDIDNCKSFADGPLDIILAAISLFRPVSHVSTGTWVPYQPGIIQFESSRDGIRCAHDLWPSVGQYQFRMYEPLRGHVRIMEDDD